MSIIHGRAVHCHCCGKASKTHTEKRWVGGWKKKEEQRALKTQGEGTWFRVGFMSLLSRLYARSVAHHHVTNTSCWHRNYLPYLHSHSHYVAMAAESMECRSLVWVCLYVCFVVVLRHSNSISVISWRWYGDVMYEMRRRKPEPALSGIFNLPHHISMVWEEMAFEGVVNYTQRINGLQHS